MCAREQGKLKTHDNKVLKIIYLYLRRTVTESTCMTEVKAEVKFSLSTPRRHIRTAEV